jgi:hypothetical protein
VLNAKRHIVQQEMLRTNVASLANGGDIQLLPGGRRVKDSTDVLVCQGILMGLLTVKFDHKVHSPQAQA